jgi:hypothetical protein
VKVVRAVVTSSALVLAHSLLAGAATAQEAGASRDSARWQFDVTPYLWASGLKGTVGVLDRTVDIDVSFSELLRHLDGALMLPVEGRKNRFGFGLEVIYVKVSDDRATPGVLFTGAKLEASQTMREIGPRFRVVKSKRVAFDLLGGARWWKLSNTLTLQRDTMPELRTGLSKSWVDLIGGGRVVVSLKDRWLFQARGDVGGLGSSLTWQALGLLGYTFGPRLTLRAGYRHLDVDFRDDDDNGFLYDVGIGGLILGGTVKF